MESSAERGIDRCDRTVRRIHRADQINVIGYPAV
jgi:hypothetical protein